MNQNKNPKDPQLNQSHLNKMSEGIQTSEIKSFLNLGPFFKSPILLGAVGIAAVAYLLPKSGPVFGRVRQFFSQNEDEDQDRLGVESEYSVDEGVIGSKSEKRHLNRDSLRRMG